MKDDRDSDEPIALREDAEECDEGARAAGLDALIREELGQILRAWDKKRESDFARACAPLVYLTVHNNTLA